MHYSTHSRTPRTSKLLRNAVAKTKRGKGKKKKKNLVLAGAVDGEAVDWMGRLSQLSQLVGTDRGKKSKTTKRLDYVPAKLEAYKGLGRGEHAGRERCQNGEREK